LRLPKAKPLLPSLLKRLHTDTDAVQTFIDSWGPAPRDRYGLDLISFLIQAPKKAYAFWEWNGQGISDFGVVLERCASNDRRVLGRGLGSLGEFWLDVEPDQEYVVELVGWGDDGQQRTLLRSSKIRTPRDSVSANTDATFIDVSSQRRFTVQGGKGPLGGGLLGKLGASERLGSSPLKI
jgi:hypothetical protein